jgi:SAM-dependent methyltransferase
VLTVDFDRLGLEEGMSVLDLGCGAGRHAFECVRRGARVVAFDADAVELKGVVQILAAMADAGEIPSTASAVAVRGTAYELPFPAAAFDRVIAAEVLEHLPDDERAMAELARVLKPDGKLAVTVPRFGPEVANWALSREYHDIEGGHIRIYRRTQLTERLGRAGLKAFASHHAHALHSPYWWLRCLVGPRNEQNRFVSAYHRFLVWDITKRPRLTRLADRILNPLIGKSLVVYLEPAAGRQDAAGPAPRPAGQPR